MKKPPHRMPETRKLRDSPLPRETPIYAVGGVTMKERPVRTMLRSFVRPRPEEGDRDAV